MEKNSFFKENLILPVSGLLIALIWATLGYIYDINPEFLFYEIAFLLIVHAIVLLIRYSRYRKEKASVNIQDNSDEHDNYELLKEKEDFFSLWAHQIKTPISAMNLLLQNDDPDRAGCRRELFKIENYVEMALNYSRFESMSGDLALEKCRLLPMVKQTVKKFSQIFIYKHLKVDIDIPDIMILTDEKWFCFVLEQLISNSLKYTKEGGIRIYTEEIEHAMQIVISDTGVGIRSEDLPRIFEKGFTGYNGRMDKKASGLGLYLCRGVCEKLGHGISAESEPGRGTKVSISISEIANQSNLTKM